MKRKIKLITCETCGANTEYFAIVDNKKLCAKCEQRTKSKNQRIIELCNQIDQLEQQLEESFTEEDVEGLIEDREKTIKFLQHQLAEKDKQLAKKEKKLLEFKRDRLYFELLLTRLQWLHKKADDYRQEKERFGVADMSLSSVWDVLELKKNDLCEYEEMCALQEGIECIANSKLLADIEHDLQVKATRSEDEIFKDIEQIDHKIKELKGEI